MDEVSDGFHTDTARGKGTEEDVQEPTEEPHGPRDEDEDEEPDHRPAPLQSHDVM